VDLAREWTVRHRRPWCQESIGHEQPVGSPERGCGSAPRLAGPRARPSVKWSSRNAPTDQLHPHALDGLALPRMTAYEDVEIQGACTPDARNITQIGRGESGGQVAEPVRLARCAPLRSPVERSCFVHVRPWWGAWMDAGMTDPLLLFESVQVNGGWVGR
jgi:hypothetical protein